VSSSGSHPSPRFGIAAQPQDCICWRLLVATTEQRTIDSVHHDRPITGKIGHDCQQFARWALSAAKPNSSAVLRFTKAYLLSLGRKIAFDLGRRDFWGSGKIHDLAALPKEIELAGPIGAHHQAIDVVFLDVVRLLPPVDFRKYKIDVSDSAEHLTPLFKIAIALLSFLPIKLVA
jgi:hypothetical protein